MRRADLWQDKLDPNGILSPGKQGIWSEASRKWKKQGTYGTTNGVSNSVFKEIKANDLVKGTPHEVGKVNGIEVVPLQVQA
jgi:hypothetical protein